MRRDQVIDAGGWARMALGVAASRGVPALWTRELVAAALQRDARRRGRSPKAVEWQARGAGRPTAQHVQYVFGGWNAALRAAGLATRSPVA
jgi:hypothetical protein